MAIAVRKLFEGLKTTNPREKAVLALGFVAVMVGGYFFVIEPLTKKTQQLQQTAVQRQVQLTQMQSMVSELLRQPKSTQSSAQLLAGKTANKSLIDGKSVIKTQALDSTSAKALFRQLAPLGKVELHSIETEKMEVWFWQK